MDALFLVLVLLAVAALAPWLGTDTSDARSEAARPENGWWPGIDARLRPRN
jgi:hypothetical protein